MRVAILEDDQTQIDIIKNIISGIGDIQCDVDCFSSNKDILATDLSIYQIFLLDIEVGDKSGLEVAKAISHKNNNAFIFFVTSHTKYISEAFKLMPFQYILKPINKELFIEEFKRAVDKMNSNLDRIVVKSKGEEIAIAFSDLYYIEYIDRKVVFETSAGKIETYNTLKSLLNEMPNKLFLRCHSGYIVNLSKIAKIKNNDIYLVNGKVIPLSRKHASFVKQALLDYRME